MDDEINYLPYHGEVLPNGNLSIPTFGRFASGEIWYGRREITPEHPNFVLWLSQINNKDVYNAVLKEERKRAREQRRRQKGQDVDTVADALLVEALARVQAEEVEAIRVGLEACDAGRVRPFSEFAAEMRAKCNLPTHLSDEEIFSDEDGLVDDIKPQTRTWN